MALPNIFTEVVSEGIIQRINRLTPTAQPQWGTMDVAKMLAHCCVTYEFVYENKHPKPNFLKRWLLTSFVKNTVTNEVPYKPSERTAPEFIMTGSYVFEAERARLIGYIQRTQALGEAHFEGKESHSFGTLRAIEWNNMFYKHLDHHLRQFGV